MLEWGLLGVGVFLVWAAATGRPPGATVRAVLTQQPLPPAKHLTTSAVFTKDVGPPLGKSGEFVDRKQGVIDVALTELGKPYKWGAEGPDMFDCSGLTRYAYLHGAQETIPRTAALQAAMYPRPPSPANGDLVFLGHPAYHVGLYYQGQYINAPDVGQVVKISPIPAGAYYGRVM